MEKIEISNYQLPFYKVTTVITSVLSVCGIESM